MSKYFLMILALLSPTALASYSSSVDSRGCWDGLTSNGGDCLVVQNTSWGGSDGNRFKVTYYNQCNERIYASFCNEKTNGPDDCGASGIRGYSTKSWTTYNASGRYSYEWVGSVKSSADWVCKD